MKLFKTVLMFCILPLLNGCITSKAIHVARTPVYRIKPDKVFHLEKAVISNDKQLVIYLEGCLSNSSQHSQFTLNIPLKEIETRSEIRNLELEHDLNLYQYGMLNISRDSIHSGWATQTDSNETLKSIPVGTPIPPPSVAGASYEWEWAYAEDARVLPNTTQTLYILFGNREPYSNSWPAPLDFIYVDASSKLKYTVIRVQKAHACSNLHKAAYCLIPVTVPLDIATSPFQLIGLVLEGLMIEGLGRTP